MCRINNQAFSLCMKNNIPVYARFQWLNHPKVVQVVEKFLPKYRTGRRGYDKAVMFQWLIYKQLMNCTYRDLESMTGIDHTTFVKFRKRLSVRFWFASVFRSLSSFLAEQLESISLILDSSFVETYSKHEEEGSAYSGYKEKEGYKLHQFIDFDTRLPLLQFASAGNMADVNGGKILVNRAPPNWRVDEFSADKGYDSEFFVSEIWGKWEPKIAIPQRNFFFDGNGLNRKKRGAHRSRDPSLYRKRTEIERYFSRKKNVFNLGEEKTRHLKNFRDNCFLTSIMEILEWLSKHPDFQV